MKINDKKSIRGFFIYSDSARYEEGDFVVYGNTIYVCSPKSGSLTVIGEKPYESENFYVYLGDQITSVDEFKNFIENNGGDDKYISLSTLVSILNTYLTGINNSGIIGHEYSMNGDEVVYRVNNKISEVYGPEEGKSILTTILYDKNVNHGIFKVSKNLPEIEALVGDYGDYCILRQYSYYLNESLDSLVRVQELIDIEVSRDQRISYANIYYRSAKVNSSEINDLTFQLATAHSYSLTKKATKMFNLYSTRMGLFEERINSLQNNFCFTDIKITRSSRGDLVLQNTDETKSGYFNVKSLNEIGPITLNILTETEKNVYQSNTITVEPKLGSRNYYIKDNLYLFVELNKTAAESSLLRPMTLVNSSSYDPFVFGLGEFANITDEFPEIYGSIDVNNGDEKLISIDLEIPTNNLVIDFSTLDYKMRDNKRPVIIDYKVISNSGESSYKTIIYKSDGSLAPGEPVYRYFDLDGENVDTRRQYLLSLQEISKLKSPSLYIKEIENSYNLKFLNNTGFTLYFPSMSLLAGDGDVNFELLTGEEKLFENALITSLPKRGIYVYTKEEPENFENIKLKYSILIDDVLVFETVDAITGVIQDSLFLWGTYTSPAICFEEFSKYQITEESNISIVIDLVSEEELPEEEGGDEYLEPAATYSLRRTTAAYSTSSSTTSSPSTTTSTTFSYGGTGEGETVNTSTTGYPSDSSSPSLNIEGEEITSLIFRLGGLEAKNSKISSAYCRKYFKPI